MPEFAEQLVTSILEHHSREALDKRRKKPPIPAPSPPPPSHETEEHITSPSNHGESDEWSGNKTPSQIGRMKHRLRWWGSQLSGGLKKRQNRGGEAQKGSDSSDSQLFVSTVSVSDRGRSVSSLTDATGVEGATTRSSKKEQDKDVLCVVMDADGQQHTLKNYQ